MTFACLMRTKGKACVTATTRTKTHVHCTRPIEMKFSSKNKCEYFLSKKSCKWKRNDVNGRFE